MKRHHILVLIILLLLFLDQWLKFYIKTNFHYREEHFLLGMSWARLYFIENKGMAFGLSFGGDWGKLFLSLFRIAAVGILIYIVRNLHREKAPFGMLLCFIFILAGAIGNIIDSAFYGLIFSSSVQGGVAEFLPESGGYGRFLHGRVVDMLYFPLIDSVFPDSWPIIGGKKFQFFRPVFNLADAFISTGVIALILFYRKVLMTKKESSMKEIMEMTE